MRTISLLYQGEASLQTLIENQTLHPETPYLIRIYTAIASMEEAASIARFVHRKFPNAHLIGSSASGIIYRDKQYLDQTMILFDEYEKAQAYTEAFIWEGRTAAAVAQEIAAFAASTGARMLHVLCSGHYHDIHNFVEAFNQLNNETKLVGGVAGDILPRNIPGYVFNEKGVLKNAIVTAALGGNGLYIYNEVNIAHEPVSETYTLTACEGSYWDQVDGLPAETWLREQLGIERPGKYNDWQEIADNDEIIHFPMILENHNGSSRFLKYDASAGRISLYFSELPLNTRFRIGYTSPTACVQRSYEICTAIGEYPIESLFVYSCLFRRMYLHNCAAWELSPFQGYQICGAFIMGEISNLNGTNEFLNGACCLVGTAENEVYLRPNSDVFETLNKMEDDTQNLLNYVLKKQREAVNRKNEFLMHELLERQKQEQEGLYRDIHIGLKNYIKYKEDCKQYQYDKLCMVQVENAEMLKTHLGQDKYFMLLRKANLVIENFMLSSGYSDLLSYYILNDETFFAVANLSLSEGQFMSIVQTLFEQFQFIHVKGIEEIIVCRFVVVLHQEDMVERALNTLHANRHQQSAFLMCDQKDYERLSSREEFKIIGVLNRALENNGVVPYFQGIRDNRTGQINKYESLMRIQDIDKTVYAPGFFMETAKKYHLYSYLSEQMFKKVFDCFKNRPETVSLNFSAYDINSQEMQRLIFDRLQKHETPSNIVLEILEDEQFREMDTLRTFVAEVRKYGVKIAIDDFGSGYSNFLELAEIHPDYLKIDGGIVKNIHRSETNLKLLRTIAFMGREFDIEIIAEFVENSEIQACVLENGIQYSQGYYFSVPAGIENLKLPKVD